MDRKRTILTSGSIPSLPHHVKLHHDQSRDRWVLLAPERLLDPDETALEILHLCDGKTTIQGIAEYLSKEYNAPIDQIVKDVSAMLQELLDKNFLQVSTNE